MSKKSPVPPVPPLSFRTLADVEKIEQYARNGLRSCDDTFKFNYDKALTILRTCIVSVFDVKFHYYSSLDNFSEAWIEKIGYTTISSALGLIPASLRDEDITEMQGVLCDTLNDHLEARRSPRPAKTAARVSRKKLADSYFAQFSDETIKILDVCWAVGQHYREWKRWLKNELKDGSTPDLAFRRILTSGKRPLEFSGKPRPAKWQ